MPDAARGVSRSGRKARDINNERQISITSEGLARIIGAAIAGGRAVGRAEAEADHRAEREENR